MPVVLAQPRAVKGTALLIHAHEDAGDGQCLFLPS